MEGLGREKKCYVGASLKSTTTPLLAYYQANMLLAKSNCENQFTVAKFQRSKPPLRCLNGKSHCKGSSTFDGNYQFISRVFLYPCNHHQNLYYYFVTVLSLSGIGIFRHGKPQMGRSVVEWVTISESLLL